MQFHTSILSLQQNKGAVQGDEPECREDQGGGPDPEAKIEAQIAVIRSAVEGAGYTIGVDVLASLLEKMAVLCDEADLLPEAMGRALVKVLDRRR